MNPKNDPAVEVSQALKQYMSRYGQPPTIIECHADSLPLPEGMNLVVKRVRIPANILLLGVSDEEEISVRGSESQSFSVEG
jgi:hypothetical protein